MTSKPQLKSVRLLARLYGLENSYVDVGGGRRQASGESLGRLLTILGAKVSRQDEVEESIDVRRKQSCQQACDPTIIAWNGACKEITLRIPRGCRDVPRIELQLEEGGTLDLSQACGPVGASADQADCDQRLLRFPQRLPSGYHSLRVELGPTSSTSTVISAPRRAFGGEASAAAQDWGVVTPVYALRSERNWGSGDLSDLQDAWRWLESRGGRVLGTLPLMAIHLQEPFDPSPYAPLSRMAWNEFYLAIDRLPEWVQCAAARNLVGSASFQEQLRQRRDDPLVDYPRQCKLRRPVLELLARHLFDQRGPRWTALQQAACEEPFLEDYARFRALWERLGRPWPEWPQRQRAGQIEPGDFDQAAYEYHLYVQWAVREQVAELGGELRAQGGTLYLDYPVGVHRHGYDAWRHADLFVPQASVGAPPDAVFTKGQDWGLAPLSPDRLHATAYRYFVDSIRCQLQQAGALRIDHVMGLHRQYWIPEGMSAADGVFMRYPAEELYAVLCLESHRHRARLIGENLGTVPLAVNRALARHGIGGTYVAQYELRAQAEAPLPAPQPLSAASINTHDMPTLAAYWQGLDLNDLLQLGLFDERGIALERRRREQLCQALVQFLRKQGLLAGGEREPAIASVRNAMLLWLARSAARSLLISVEDLWLEVSPQNVPGTSSEFPNWRRKLRHELNPASERPEIDDILRRIGKERLGNGANAPMLSAGAEPQSHFAPSEALR